MSNLKYTNEHEWLKIEGDTALIGITSYAKNALGDLVYLELPEIGRKVNKGDYFAVVESVKAASEIYTPVSGEIVSVNDNLPDNLDNLSEDVDKGWIIKLKLKDPAEASGLMDQKKYEEYTASLK